MKTPAIYGVGITFANAVITLIFHLLGFSTSAERFGTYMIVAVASTLSIFIIGIILGTRAVRAEKGPLEFSYGSAFKTGFLIAVFAGLTGLVFQFVYFKFINPEFAEVTIEWTRGMMERVGARQADIDRVVDDVRTKSTMTRQLVNGLIFTLIAGTLISLITAAVLKRPAADAPGELPPSLA